MSQEKISLFKKSWKNIVTGITCAVVGAGVMFGADTARLQDTITKAEAKNAIIAAATYSAETAVKSVKGITTETSKKEAIANAVKAVQDAIPQFIEAAKTAKETVKETVRELTDTVKKDVKKADEVLTESKTAKGEAKTTKVETNTNTVNVKQDK